MNREVKRIVLILLLSYSVCYSADITDLAGLKSFAAAGGTATIAPGTYTLKAILTFAASCTLTQDGTAGDVIIDGNNRYCIVISNSASGIKTLNFVGTAAGRIVFRQGSDSCVRVHLWAERNDVIVNFTYCDFADSNNGEGLNITGNYKVLYNVTATCTNCRAYNNKNDGFAINTHPDPNLTVITSLTLNDCNSYNNDPELLGGTAGDGATCHYANHILTINGGNYHSNGKTGVAAIGGSKLIIYGGANFYNNGAATAPSNGFQIYHSGTSTIHGVCLIDGANVWIDSGQTAAMLLGTGNGNYVIKNSIFNFANCLNNFRYPPFTIENEVQLSISNCIFKNCRATSIEMADIPIKAVGLIANNVFYNNKMDFHLHSQLVAFQNNIFYKTAGSYYVFMCIANEYDKNPLNGYNDFYGLANEAAYFYNDTGGFASTDLNVNPSFANADYIELAAGSACINAGKSLLEGGYSSMGAWQGMAIAVPQNCSESIEADFNSDCKVDFKDFAIFAADWLKCNLTSQETCWE